MRSRSPTRSLVPLASSMSLAPAQRENRAAKVSASLREIARPTGAEACRNPRELQEASGRVLAMQVVDRYAMADRRALQPFGMAQRARRVLIARFPVLAHRGPREFIVLGV